MDVGFFRRLNGYINSNTLQKFRHIGLIVAWLLFALFAFKAATTKPTETKAWDPFEILGISEGAEASAVRKAFRKLSLIYHPDKVEADKKEEAETKYVELSKAYKALTDEESRKNWEEFGHPDGKQSISVGIALPAWLVEAGSKHKVLALYTLIFGIILPLVISKWWTQSRTVTKDQILTGTMDRFAIEMRPGMKWTELLVLVSAALEFKVDTTRAPDGTVKPGMSSPDKAGMQKLFTAVNDAVDERLGEKLERPKRLMADEHGWKAYLLLLSHVVRADLDDPVLEADRRFAVSKAAHLLTGMMHVAISRWSLIMVHAVIDLGQILVQACHSFKMGPLWQLPHVDNEIMKHIKTKKRNVLTVANVVDMPENERRDLFRDLSDEQYEQLVEVAKRMPRIMVEKLEPRVIGEDQIETNAFITVFLKLKLKIPAKESGEPNKEEKKKDEEEKDEFADQEEDEEKPWWEIRAVSGEAVHAPYWPAVGFQPRRGSRSIC